MGGRAGERCAQFFSRNARTASWHLGAKRQSGSGFLHFLRQTWQPLLLGLSSGLGTMRNPAWAHAFASQGLGTSAAGIGFAGANPGVVDTARMLAARRSSDSPNASK